MKEKEEQGTDDAPCSRGSGTRSTGTRDGEKTQVGTGNAEEKLRFAKPRVVMTTEDDGFDARQAARDELALDGRTLALILENIVAEAAQQIRYIRGKLKAKADSPKGLSGRTLVEWHKAEAMAMSTAKAITAMGDGKGQARTYEEMLRHLRSGG